MYERKYQPKVHLEMVPKLLRHAVYAADLQVQAPLEIALVSALTAMALSCQGLIDVKSPPGFLSPVTLYLWVIAMSGERKSALDKIFLKPIVDREKAAEALLAELKERHEAAIEVWQIKLKQFQADLAQDLKAGKNCLEAEEALAKFRATKPVLGLHPRWLYQNTTIPDFAVPSLRSLSGTGSEAAQSVMEADLAESYRSSAFINTDWDEVRRMFDSGNTIWFGSYAIALDDAVGKIAAISSVLAENHIHTISRAVVVMTGSNDLLGLTGTKAMCAALRDGLGLERWTFGVVHRGERSDRVRVTLLLEAPQS
jgi:hypothetical protein